MIKRDYKINVSGFVDMSKREADKYRIKFSYYGRENKKIEIQKLYSIISNLVDNKYMLNININISGMSFEIEMTDVKIDNINKIIEEVVKEVCA